MQRLVVDETKIKKAILSGFPFSVTTFTMPRETEIYIEEVISLFLKYAGKESLKDYIVYSVLELAANAKKANAKRVYFIERDLDISDENDYREGMEHFKENALDNSSHFVQLQEEKGLYIRLSLQMLEDVFHAGIGALIAEKWNFPEQLVAAIRYHHNPSAAPADCRTLVDGVYLANMFCEYEKGKGASGNNRLMQLSQSRLMGDTGIEPVTSTV